MKVLVYNVSLLFGAGGDKKMKIEYLAESGALKLTGHILCDAYPTEKWVADEVEKVIEADIRSKADAVAAALDVVARYKEQEIDITVEDVFGIEEPAPE